MTTSFALGPRVRRSRNRPADLAFELRILDLAGRGGGLPSPLVQEIRWTIHRVFVDYQTASEERRQLAATVGELTRELVEVLTDAGWSEHDARDANVHELANPARSR